MNFELNSIRTELYHFSAWVCVCFWNVQINYGTYVSHRVICCKQYVSQTVNKFSKIWSAHWCTWNKPDKTTATKWS